MKKLLSFALALILVVCATLPLASCGKKDDKTIVVGASSAPHAEILEQVKEVLKEKGYTLEIKIYDDYVLPNTAVENGDIDANYFQHTPYLDWFNGEEGTHIVSVAKIHYEPFGIYGKGVSNLDKLSDGATILIPTDGSNQTRALLLLQQEGLIQLKDGVKATDDINVNDITGNSHNYVITPVSAETLTSQLSNANNGTIAVINGNYAIAAGLKIADALATESVTGDAAQTYANIVAVKEGNENSAKIKALVNALRSTKVKNFIAEKYNGAVVAVFPDSVLDLEIE